MGIVLQVATDCGEFFTLLASELTLGSYLPEPGNHRAHLASQNPQHPIVDKLPGGIRIAIIEQTGSLPYPRGGMQQIENFDPIVRRQIALARLPKRFLSI